MNLYFWLKQHDSVATWTRLDLPVQILVLLMLLKAALSHWFRGLRALGA
jgi:hypothetical protein